MKKLYYFTVVILSIFLLCACNKGNETSELDLKFSEHFGSTMDEYLKNTNTSQEAIKESLPGTGVWQFTEKVAYKEIQFTKLLHVDTANNIICGGGYQCVIENPDESTYELIYSIKKDIVNQFGEPTTYAGLDNVLSNMKNFSDIAASNGAVERWTVESEDSIEIPAYEGVKMVEEIELEIICLNGKANIKIVRWLRADEN